MNQPLLEVETLTFKIGLSGTYWGKVPQYSILIDGATVAEGSINNRPDNTEYITFEKNFEENQEFLLSIRLNNKEDSDTILDDSNTEIVKDMLLNIDSIEIDGIELEILKWTESQFVPDNPERPILTHCVNLGWNGAYQLRMTSPFYIWLLENM